jgi:ribulose 1,5-bisphosphate synthetase/thiazole synthase
MGTLWRFFKRCKISRKTVGGASMQQMAADVDVAIIGAGAAALPGARRLAAKSYLGDSG